MNESPLSILRNYYLWPEGSKPHSSPLFHTSGWIRSTYREAIKKLFETSRSLSRKGPSPGFFLIWLVLSYPGFMRKWSRHLNKRKSSLTWSAISLRIIIAYKTYFFLLRASTGPRVRIYERLPSNNTYLRSCSLSSFHSILACFFSFHSRFAFRHLPQQPTLV